MSREIPGVSIHFHTPEQSPSNRRQPRSPIAVTGRASIFATAMRHARAETGERAIRRRNTFFTKVANTGGDGEQTKTLTGTKFRYHYMHSYDAAIEQLNSFIGQLVRGGQDNEWRIKGPFQLKRYESTGLYEGTHSIEASFAEPSLPAHRVGEIAMHHALLTAHNIGPRLDAPIPDYEAALQEGIDFEGGDNISAILTTPSGWQTFAGLAYVLAFASADVLDARTPHGPQLLQRPTTSVRMTGN